MKAKKFISGISILCIISLIFLHYRDKIFSDNFFAKKLEAVTGLVLDRDSSKLSVDNLTGTPNDDISKVTVTFYGDTATQMGITWYTKEDKNYGSDIQLFDAATRQEVDFQKSVETGNNTNDASWIYHQIVLSGLTEGTKYLYRVGDKDKDCWSAMGSFQTADPNAEDFEFLALSDTQGEAQYAASALKEAKATVPNASFLLHSGDFVDDACEEKLWTEMVDTSKDVLMNLPIVPTVGNHETATNAFWQHFNLLSEAEQKAAGVYYSLDYGKVHFAVLNTNESTADDNSYVDETQLEWLKNDLAHAKENGCEWIIVNMHIGSYAVGDHAGDTKLGGDNGMRLRLGAVFEQYGVNLVIEGHDHIPCVTYGIVQGKKADKGVVYMDTGAAGPKAYKLTTLMPDTYFDLFQYMDRTDRNNNIYQDFADIQVQKDKIHVILYERNTMKKGQPLSILYTFDVVK